MVSAAAAGSTTGTGSSFPKAAATGDMPVQPRTMTSAPSSSIALRASRRIASAARSLSSKSNTGTLANRTEETLPWNS